jgi:23S rRNA pseudouridine1911/1915/1917 synthase
MSNIELSSNLSSEHKGLRFDAVVARIFPEFSRERLKKWILDGSCQAVGKSLRPRDLLSGDEQIILKVNLTPALTDQPEEAHLEIIYVDEHILVVNKPTNLVVHPGAGNRNGTLLNALLSFDPQLSNLPRAGIIHRLDKDTTGVLIVARTLESHTSLVRQFQERTVEKIYHAVVYGILLAGTTIDKPIARHPHERTKMAVVNNGKPAITHFRVAERFQKHTLLEISIETGRTHQIRVHFAHIKHPVVGDQMYAARLQPLINRQALHASSLTIEHPVTMEPMTFNAPLPSDFVDLLAHLRTIS